MWVIINIIFILFLLWGIWASIKYFTKGNTVIQSIKETTVLNPFNTKSTQSVIRSSFFPDQLYVNKMVKLDPSIKHLFPSLLFAFPTDQLIVKKFNYFDIDGNKFEEVVFDNIGVSGYMTLIDSVEDNLYFLNRLMSLTIPEGIVPEHVLNDVISLTEDGVVYVYEDMSGLITVDLNGKDRLIRVYSRDVNQDNSEYLICIQDELDVVHYYVGFLISITQLEDI